MHTLYASLSLKHQATLEYIQVSRINNTHSRKASLEQVVIATIKTQSTVLSTDIVETIFKLKRVSPSQA